MSTTILSRRAINRTTLERQVLLRREPKPALEAIEHLVAINAQDPRPPYLTLWARLPAFTPDMLTELLYDRRVVRSPLLRGTQHMTAATDYRWLRPLLDPVILRTWRAAFGRFMHGVDLDELAGTGRVLLDGRTLTRSQLRDQLAERWPDRDPQALGRSVQSLVPVVHPPPNGTWGRWGATTFALAEDWLGEPVASDPSPDEMIRRYLAAFGPATVKDIQVWSGLTRLREVVERLRQELRIYRDEDGTELHDLPDAPRPDPDTPAPVRLLPDFDNLMLAHADRTRVMTNEQRARVCVGSATNATVLVDGFVAGIWTITREGGTATLVVEPLSQLSADDRSAVAGEAARLLEFAAADADLHDLRFTDCSRWAS